MRTGVHPCVKNWCTIVNKDLSGASLSGQKKLALTCRQLLQVLPVFLKSSQCSFYWAVLPVWPRIRKEKRLGGIFTIYFRKIFTFYYIHNWQEYFQYQGRDLEHWGGCTHLHGCLQARVIMSVTMIIIIIIMVTMMKMMTMMTMMTMMAMMTMIKYLKVGSKGGGVQEPQVWAGKGVQVN